MGEPFNFDDIRPYHDSEVNQYLHTLINDPSFNRILTLLYQDERAIAGVKQMVADINSVKELQSKLMYPLVESFILKRTVDSLTCSGLDNLEESKSYLFISNHRDIILDAALLNYLIARDGLHTTEIAIGNNLLIEDWIEHTVKLNRAFEVKRNLPVRELLTASKKLSTYIRQDIVERNISVWIAQREGRTKDGNDLTQPALLKMLNLSNEKNFVDGFRELRIVPLSISYEIEPCGISKVEELYKKETEGFVKTQADDLRSMGMGLLKPKGRVHFAFGRPMRVAIDEMDKHEQLSDKIDALADYVDQRVYRNYKLWPNNFVAADLLSGEKQHAEEYTGEQEQAFMALLDEAIDSIAGDKARIREMFLKLYANPVFNKESVKFPNGYF